MQGCWFMITSSNKPLLTLSCATATCATMILFVILCQFKPKHEVWSGTKEKNTFFTNYVLVLYWWPQRPTQSPHLGQKSDFLPKKSTFKANNRLLWQNLGYLGHLYPTHYLGLSPKNVIFTPSQNKVTQNPAVLVIGRDFAMSSVMLKGRGPRVCLSALRVILFSDDLKQLVRETF